jgi:hypothetical protein
LSDGLPYLRHIQPALQRLSEMFPGLRLKVAIRNGTGQPRQFRYRNHAAMGLGLDAGKMRLQNFAIHGRRHGRGRVRCRRK